MRNKFPHGKVCLVWLGLMVILVGFMNLGVELTFNVYAVRLKQSFNFSQTQVELVAGSGVIGLGLSLVDLFLYARLGHALWCFLIWFFTTASVLSMWIAVVYRDVLQHWPFLICVIQLATSAAEINGFTRLLDNLVNSFTEQNTGKLVGISLAASSSAKIFYGEILEHFFSDDLAGFFLTAAIGQSTSLGLSFIIHRVQNGGCRPAHASEGEEGHVASSMSLQNHSSSSQTTGIDKLQSDRDVRTLIKSCQFHLTFWPSVIMYSIMYTYMINVTSIAHAQKIPQSVRLVYALSVTIITGRAIAGVVFDKFRTQTCGFCLVLVGSLSTALGLFLLVLGPTETILYAVTLLLGLALSLGFTIPCTLLTMQFGHQHFSFIIGCFLCLSAGFCLMFQFFVGNLYDRFLSADNFCYGPSCFRLSFTVMLVLTVLLICVHVFNFLRYACKHK